VVQAVARSRGLPRYSFASMAKRITPNALHALTDALATIFWFKSDLRFLSGRGYSRSRAGGISGLDL
jgi:hypothetical protein